MDGRGLGRKGANKDHEGKDLKTEKRQRERERGREREGGGRRIEVVSEKGNTNKRAKGKHQREC